MSMLMAATWVAAFLLVLAGARKALQPRAAGTTLQAARLPSDARLVRALGVGELLIGLAVLVVGGTASTAALAAAYGVFAIFAQRQRRSGADCGCFGATGTPVTALHVWVDVVAAATAAIAATHPTPPLVAVAAEQPAVGVAAGVLVMVAANLVRLLLTALPDLSAARSALDPDGAA